MVPRSSKMHKQRSTLAIGSIAGVTLMSMEHVGFLWCLGHRWPWLGHCVKYCILKLTILLSLTDKGGCLPPHLLMVTKNRKEPWIYGLLFSTGEGWSFMKFLGAWMQDVLFVHVLDWKLWKCRIDQGVRNQRAQVFKMSRIVGSRYFRNVGIYAAVGFFCGIGVCPSNATRFSGFKKNAQEKHANFIYLCQHLLAGRFGQFVCLSSFVEGTRSNVWSLAVPVEYILALPGDGRKKADWKGARAAKQSQDDEWQQIWCCNILGRETNSTLLRNRSSRIQVLLFWTPCLHILVCLLRLHVLVSRHISKLRKLVVVSASVRSKCRHS